MHLEELATELGTSATDLAAAAGELGFADVTPTSTLTPDQAAALRARFAGPAGAAPVAPEPPAGFAPPAAQPPAGFAPPAAQPPAGFAPPAGQPPAGFAPPAATPPAGFAPPPGQPPAAPPSGFAGPAGFAPPAQYAPTPSAVQNPYATPPAAAPASAPTPAPKRRFGVVLVVAVIAVIIGIAAFVVSSADDDSDGSDSNAASEEAGPENTAPQEVGPTGPDGKPLTQAEKDGLAKMKEAEEANKQKACDALRPISEADQNEAPIPPELDTFEELQQYAIDEIARLKALYDPAIAALPSQADGIRKIQATYQGIIDAFAGATTADQLEVQLDSAEQQFTSSGAWDAVNELDSYAQENCGFSLNQN